MAGEAGRRASGYAAIRVPTSPAANSDVVERMNGKEREREREREVLGWRGGGPCVHA